MLSIAQNYRKKTISFAKLGKNTYLIINTFHLLRHVVEFKAEHDCRYAIGYKGYAYEDDYCLDTDTLGH